MGERPTRSERDRLRRAPNSPGTARSGAGRRPPHARRAATIPVGPLSASSKKRLQRGVRLFRQLVALADAGESVGVSYAQFVCHLHGVSRYEQAVGRNYCRADTPLILWLAGQVTAAAGGRQPVTRYGVTIRVGMDSFIWRKDRPHPRPAVSFASTPYTESEWKVVFPDGARRLLQPG